MFRHFILISILIILGFRIKYTNSVSAFIYTIDGFKDRLTNSRFNFPSLDRRRYWRYWIQGTGYRIQDTGYWILDTGYWIQDTGYRILDTGYWIQDTEY